MKSRTIILSLCSVILLFFWQCTTNPTEPDGPAANEIWFQSGAVTPKTLTVSRGTTVEWLNMSNETHGVDSGAPMNPAGLFTSGNLTPGDPAFPHTFNSVGSFNYFCLIHQNRSAEQGAVVVTP